MSVAVPSSEIYDLVEMLLEAGILALEWKPIGLWLEYEDGSEKDVREALRILRAKLSTFKTSHEKRLFFGHVMETMEAMTCAEDGPEFATLH